MSKAQTMKGTIALPPNHRDVFTSVCHATFAVFVLCTTSLAAKDWSFRVVWGDSNVTVFSYPVSVWSDCLYDVSKDTIICDHNHDYNNIKSRLTYDPELIEYLSVRCVAQTYHPSDKHSCFCKSKPPLSGTSSYRSSVSSSGDTSFPVTSKSLPVAFPTISQIHTDNKSQMNADSSSSTFSSSSSSAASFSSPAETESYNVCQLYRLSPAMFKGLTSLEVLDLSYNWITSFQKNTFQNLTSLKVLSLRNNPLSKLHANQVCLPTKLEILDLSLSQLGTFPTAFLQNCPFSSDSKPVSLTYLDISHAQLRKIPIRAFWYFGTLRYLNVSDNAIHHLPDNPFIGAFNLTSLDLSNNNLQELPESFCEGITNLERLTISNNLLSAVNFSSIEVCGKLRFLDISNNTLGRLEKLPLRLPHLEMFNASRNRLTEINGSLFEIPSAIRILDLSHNNLNTIWEKALENLSNLNTLLLQHNNLEESEANLDIVTSARLSHLDLSHNIFTSLQDGFLSHLDHINYLDLSSNWISFVHSRSFGGLKSLNWLSLSNNSLLFLENGTFSGLLSLKSMNLSDNALNETMTTVGAIPSLEILDLKGNRFTQIPELILPSLSRLNLARNLIFSIKNGDFSGVPNITQLDLSQNLINHLDTGAFANLTLLIKLDLANNKLAWLPSNTLSSLNHLKHFDISFNRITSVSHFILPKSLTVLVMTQNNIDSINQTLNFRKEPGLQLSKILLNRCGIRYVNTTAFKDLIYLREVDISDNKIQTFSKFEGHPGIKFNLLGNPLVCSCHIAWLRWQFSSHVNAEIHSNYVIDVCILPTRNYVIPVIGANREDFVCEISQSCPENCTCYAQEVKSEPEIVMCTGKNLTSIPRNLPENAGVISLDDNQFGVLEYFSLRNLPWRELYLNSSNISNISSTFFDKIPNLLVLDLSDNYLEIVNKRWFDNLKNVSYLSLANNWIVSLPSNFLENQQNLRTLNLSVNRIMYLSDGNFGTLLKVPKLAEVYLGYNDWICDCENEIFIKFVQYHRSGQSRHVHASESGFEDHGLEIQDVHSTTCKGAPELKLVNFDLSDLDCDGSDHRRKMVILIVCIIFFIVCCVASFCFYHRKLLASILYYRFRMTFIKQSTALDHQPELSGQFDITIVCDQADNKIQWWVESVLVSKLHNPHWRFSVKYPRKRELEQGEGQTDMTVHSVNRSRCSLLVITSGFARNQQCMSCFQKALQRRRSGLHSIVLITWGHITADVMTMGFRPFFNKGLFLPITARLFWERLFHQLPLPRHKLTMGPQKNFGNFQIQDKDQSSRTNSKVV